MIKKRTAAVLVLVIFSLFMLTVDWRASALIAVLAAVMAIANLQSAK